jgi:hypothetical protein
VLQRSLELKLRRSPLAGEPTPPEVVKAELAGMLAIRRAGLPPSLLASLKHLASLHNPQFYERQRMGFSVWNTPRFLRCYAETLEHLYLPRGVLDEAQALVKEAGSRLEITDVPDVPHFSNPIWPPIWRRSGCVVGAGGDAKQLEDLLL